MRILRSWDNLSGQRLTLLSQHTSGNKKAEEDANKDAETKIKEIKEAGKKGQDQVVKELLKAVFDIKPVVPDRIEVPK
jgi:V-type H+-transporting ATPase subunit G